MMESARLRTEFYSSPPDGKWPHDLQQMADVISVDVNTCEEYFIDDLVDFDTSLEQTSHKMSSPVYRLGFHLCNNKGLKNFKSKSLNS